MRALSSVAIAKPSAVIKCNDDMESLIADNNRSIATFAITTLLKTGSESSVDRLMKQISSFMNEIADEFKIVVVTAIRELCLKYPLKHRVLVGFLANFLREEGGFEFKKAIVDAIIALMCVISETKESSLFHLCEFIEDCEFTALSTQILHLVGIVGPTTVAPARYIRFVYNRVILENAAVRAAAITTLAKFAARLPALQASVSVLLRRSLRDEDDEVRDRATVALRLLGENITKDAPGDGEAEGSQRPFRQDALAADSTRDLPLQPEIHLLLEPLPMSFAQLSAALKEFEVAGSREDDALALSLTTLPVVDYTRPSSQSAVPASASLSSSNDSAELYKIPELATLGRVHSSTSPIQLTESETEYVVSCIKHIMSEHVVLEFAITNTISDQLLVDACIVIEQAPDSPQHYDHVASVHAPILRCGATERAWLILRGSPGSTFGAPAHFLAELKFRVVEIDPATGEFEGDEEGFPEDYPLEDIEISTADFVAKADISNFRQAWDSLEKDKEVLQKYSLQFKDMEVAIDAVISCLGMQPEDGTNEIDKSRIGMPHTLHLSGCFAGNLDILARAQLQVEDKLGCILKIAVRSPQLEVSELISDCIN
jgi:coatomer protein complex subunit gamma